MVPESRRAWAVAAGVAAICALAGCGSSDDTSSSSEPPPTLSEIQTCLGVAGVSVTNAGKDIGLFVPVGGGRNAVVAVAGSEAEAQQDAEDFESFGATAGKTATVRVEGPVWAGFPGQVDAALQQKVEHCAFD